MQAENGVHFTFLQKAKEVVSQEGIADKGDKQFALTMDEMKIMHGLVFRKHTGELVGFCDFGAVNRESEELAAAVVSDSNDIIPKLAEQMLVFIIHPKFRPPLSFMVASYASLCLSGE